MTKMNIMNILIVGSGGREHSIAWKIKQSPKVNQLYIAPGNAGTSLLGTNLPVAVSDFEGLKKAVISYNIDLVLVGPEVPLCEGLHDFFSADEQLKDTLFVGIRLLDIDILQFLKRFDMVAFLVWMFIMFCTLIAVFYALTEYTKRIFYKAKNSVVLIIVGGIAYILALLLPSYDVATMLFNNIAIYFGLIPAFIIPLFLLIVAKVKKY